ncbi:MAG: RidA family protein [Rhodospirillaceae bacterium]|nr:RidA family protein [Rhodospirillaceae bacterium]
MEKEIGHVPVLSDIFKKSGVPLSPVVKANGFLFVSGMPPFDTQTGKLVQGDIQTQTRAVLEALKVALESNGSSLAKVVKCTVFAANAGYFPQINEIYAQYFKEAPPARTFVAVGSWPMPFDIEIECIALA